MNRQTKEVFQASLDNESELLGVLEQNYIDALADVKKKIKDLQDLPDTQSRAYQIAFQKQLEEQINGCLDILQENNIQSIDEYLSLCYETGFIGGMYELQANGAGVVSPISQRAMVNATRLTADNVKLSTKIIGDTDLLKTQVIRELQRGFSTAMPFADIARNISARGQASMNRAMRIARTEGNRVQNQATMDSADAAVKAGVDTVKQWVATLDAKTRTSHQDVDGEWVELDDTFSNGLRYPGDPNAPAGEIVNCRCKVALMPRWAVEKKTPRFRLDGMTGEIIECENYAEYKQKYLMQTGQIDRINWQKMASSNDREQFERYRKILGKNAPKTLDEFCKIKYNKGVEYVSLQRKYRDANLQHKIKNTYNLSIEEGKQGKHIKGHNNYKQGKSYITISIEDAQKLVDKYAGSGMLERDSKGRWKHTEIILANEDEIGYVISVIDGQEIKTSHFKIHYSKNGTHIVPYIGKAK